MKKLVTGILLDVTTGKISTVTIKDDLQQLYAILHCDLIDIVTRTVGGQPFTFVCDDEGLFHDKPIVSATNMSHGPMLVGNLFICNEDGKGNLSSLSASQQQHILSHAITISSPNMPQPHSVLCDVDY